MPAVQTIWDDVSHYQGAFNPSRFTVAKVTEGTDFLDDQYAGIKARAVAKKLHFAAYHFLHAGNVMAQAKWAFLHAGKTPLMLDVEEYGSGSFASMQDVVDFIKSYRTLGGIIRVAYIPKWFWQNRWDSRTMKAISDLQIKNINSDYSNAGDAQALATFGGLTVLGRQYTNSPHDMNRAPISPAALWTAFSGETAPAVHAPGSRELVLTSPVMTGPDVLFVQQHIKQVAFDSHYGPDTVSRMKWWQNQHHVTADGRCGKNSWATFGVKWTGK